MVAGTVALRRPRGALTSRSRPRSNARVQQLLRAAYQTFRKPSVYRGIAQGFSRAAYSLYGRYKKGPPARPKRKSVMGHGGRYVGNFKRMRKYKKKGPFRGVSCTVENVGEVTAALADESTLFGTHAFAAQVLGKKFFLAMLRALSFKMGSPFRNEHDPVDVLTATGTGQVGQIVVGYCLDGEPDVLEDTVNVGGADLWRTVASNLWVAFNTYITNAHTAIEFQHITFFPFTRELSGVAVGMPVKLDLRNALVDYMFIDTVKLQNRTGANTPTELDADNIEANPLRLTRYVVKGNALRLNWCNDAAISGGFVCASTTGSREINTKDATMNDGIKDLFVHAPPGSAFMGLKSRTCEILQPGAIKRSAVKKTGTMYVSTMAKVLLMSEAAGNGNDTVWGMSQWFHGEKALRTGTGTAVVNIGYEHIMGMTLTIRAAKRMPYIRANS